MRSGLNWLKLFCERLQFRFFSEFSFTINGFSFTLNGASTVHWSKARSHTCPYVITILTTLVYLYSLRIGNIMRWLCFRCSFRISEFFGICKCIAWKHYASTLLSYLTLVQKSLVISQVVATFVAIANCSVKLVASNSNNKKWVCRTVSLMFR